MLAALIACLGLLLGGLATVTIIGLYVVKRYPNEHDPMRNAKRYVNPAKAATLVALGGLVGTAVAAVIMIAQAVSAS